MSPVQIVRTVAIALIAGGVALGLMPSGPCGAGWGKGWGNPSGAGDSFGWFAYEGAPGMVTDTCQTAMAPVGSWAIALIVIGVTLLLGLWFHTSYRPKGEPKQ